MKNAFGALTWSLRLFPFKQPQFKFKTIQSFTQTPTKWISTPVSECWATTCLSSSYAGQQDAQLLVWGESAGQAEMKPETTQGPKLIAIFINQYLEWVAREQGSWSWWCPDLNIKFPFFCFVNQSNKKHMNIEERRTSTVTSYKHSWTCVFFFDVFLFN